MKKNLLQKLVHSLSSRIYLVKTLAMLMLFIFIGNNAFAQTPSAALNFDGIDDYVEVGKIMPATYTKEAWINASAFSTQTNIISGGSDGEHAFWAPSGYLSAGHNGVWNSVSDPTQLALNTWYYIAVTYDAATTTMNLYKNGVLISTNTGIAAFNGGNALRIGAYTPAANLFQGTLDEVRVWSRVLSQTEIQNTMSCELPSGQTGLVAYYKFNQGVDNTNNSAITTLTDSSENNNTGTLNNFGLNGLTSNWVASGAVTTMDLQQQ